MTHSPSSDTVTAGRPIRSVMAVGVIFLLIGALDVWRGIDPLFGSGTSPHLASDDLLVLAIGVTALIGAVHVLRGRNWARWLLATWMAIHVVISAGQLPALGMHLVIFGFMTFLLFRRQASTSFGRA